MEPRTFAEKIFNARAGSIVFMTPDIILTHDNSSSIYKTFQKMGGKNVADPGKMLVVLDHNAPPCDAKLATQYQDIRDMVSQQHVRNFYDAGNGICHQLMSYHARPGMIITGSDSHTSTAGAFNAMAAGIDRTESAGIWKRGETWFLVPESMKITLTGRLREGVYAKDLALWIIGMIGSDGANYLSVEFHGDGVKTLSISDRMTIANLASEMGAKNAVFPVDDVARSFFKEDIPGIWADTDAVYVKEITINLEEVFPVIAAPHNVDNVFSVSEKEGTVVHEGLIGTCTNGRIEDLRIAAEILKGNNVKNGFQLNIIPASREIYIQAISEGLISSLLEAGANILSPSCGPCLGTGQGIPANGHTVISTANRNFRGRMGNQEAEIYLASPAVVAYSSLTGTINYPFGNENKKGFPFKSPQSLTSVIGKGENRRYQNVWNYSDVDNLNTDQMFAGKHTYSVQSSDAAAILPFLFEDFDPSFRTGVQEGDIIIAGENFGCGSSREHPSVGLAYAGISAIIVKSVNRIFYRSTINQGLPLIVHRQAVDSYVPGDSISIDFDKGNITIGMNAFHFEPLPEKLKKIIDMKGLVNYMKAQ
jgi:homoaconitate hydratase family protein/3-isopropylmalate dehydratase small subunit